jgi:hypothetical protein
MIASILGCQRVLRIREFADNRCSLRFNLLQYVFSGLIAFAAFRVGVVVRSASFCLRLGISNRLEFLADPEPSLLVGESLEIKLRDVNLGLCVRGQSCQVSFSSIFSMILSAHWMLASMSLSVRALP